MINSTATPANQARRREQKPAAVDQGAELRLADDLEDQPTEQPIDARLAALIHDWPTMPEADRCAIDAQRVAAGGRQVAEDPPILPPAAVAVMQLLESRPPYQGTTVEDMADWLWTRTGKRWTPQSIRQNLVPLIRACGAENAPRLGYRLPSHRRFFGKTCDRPMLHDAQRAA